MMRTDAGRGAVIVGVLGGLAGALRIPFAMLPGVQPSTALVVLAGISLGPWIGAGVGVMVPVVSNLVLGHGLHTPAQIIGWGGVGFLSGLLPRLPRAPLAAWGVLAALLFGAWTDTWLWLLFAAPHTLSTWLPLAATGLSFNVLHGSATGVVLWLFGPRLDRLLTRARVRLLGRPPRPAAWRRDPAGTGHPTPALQKA